MDLILFLVKCVRHSPFLMFAGCIGAVLILLFLPFLGVSVGLVSVLAFGFMIFMHLGMMGGHNHGEHTDEDHRKHGDHSDQKSESGGLNSSSADTKLIDSSPSNLNRSGKVPKYALLQKHGL